MSMFFNSNPAARARDVQGAGMQDVYQQAASKKTIDEESPAVQKRFDAAVDRRYDEFYKEVDPQEDLNKFDLGGGGSMWRADDMSVIKPYQDMAKSIMQKLLDNKDDVLVKDVLHEFNDETKKASRSSKAYHKGTILKMHDMTYMLTQDMVRNAVEHGDIEPSQLTDDFLNSDTYGRPRMNYLKLREALKGLPDGR